MEYPLRPPLFALKLYCKLHEANYCEVDLSEWFNELRAMETEVWNRISLLIYFIVLSGVDTSISFPA